ncbi:MAG: nitroreductase family protein [Bacteroidales bacterium]|nr:MAG: nitroreductase family protein [Bacteroidales bacterium]
MIKDLVLKNRSFRRFHEDHRIGMEMLEELVDLARNSASAGNKQSLKYVLSNSERMNERIFPHLSWAGYLKDWEGPEQGEKPAAYIIILGDTAISEKFYCDEGIAAQSILLGAAEKGLGGCIIASIDRKPLRKVLKTGKNFKIRLVIALGKPKEKVMLEEAKGGNIRYWRDKEDVHHVPKRPLEEVIVKKYFE